MKSLVRMLRYPSDAMDARLIRYVLLVACVAAAVSIAVATPSAAAPENGAQAVGTDRNVSEAANDGKPTVDSYSEALSTEVEFDSTTTVAELLTSAREMFLADNYVLAEMLYKSVLIRESNHLSAMLELAVVYEAMGKLQYAKGLLTRASILKPYDQEIIDRNNEIARKLSKTLEAEVDSLLAIHAYRSALPKLSVLLTTQPENADLHFKKAQSHLKLKDPQGALDEIDRALRLRRDQQFFDLRTRALALKRDREINTLAQEVRRLTATGHDEDKERALRLVSQILELDPDHEWATRHFLILTAGDKTTGRLEAKQSRWTRIGASLGNVARVVAGKTTPVFQVMNRHLDVLLYALIVIVIFASPLTFMIVRGFTPRQSLSGRLNQFNIQEILTVIHTQNRTGVLKISSKSAKGRIFFSSGEVYHCTSGSLDGRTALRHLIDTATDGYFVFTKSPRSFRRTIDAPLSLILMDLPERSESNVANVPPEKQTIPKKKKQSRMKELLKNKV
ncbi:MAG: DUF4388 domain-containing protein [Candidatus Latescibacterota bacterium]|nr:MAG: DUF4388 domain-containing protein [Candidatus Latescibacterota bacterium]